MPKPPEPPPEGLADAKAALRRQVLASRRARPPAVLVADAEAIAAHVLAWEPVRRARTVAAYVSVGSEPGTGLLLDALRRAGHRVLLPVVLPDLDLDWAAYTGPDSLVPARLGLLEPGGPPLGLDAVLDADVLLLPGLAVSPHGARLGRGGGCYDRVLRRVAGHGTGRATAVLLHDDEVGLDVPVEPHDRPVTHAVTPGGVRALG